MGFVLKLVHFGWLFALPAAIHGIRPMLLPWITALVIGSFWLSATFIVSHNLEGAKEAERLADKSDWARYQIETSASWGGRIGSFFTGGLNLQIEHHLFPALPHHLYTDAQKIVMEECQKRNIKYNFYPTLLPNFVDHIKFLRVMGSSDATLKKSD